MTVAALREAASQLIHSLRSKLWALGAALIALAVIIGAGERPMESLDVPPPALYEHFAEDRVIEETATPDESTDRYWWVNSGGAVTIAGGVAAGLMGDLGEESSWRTRYRASNPVDTDDGAHPQNLLRLLTRDRWRNERQIAYFRIRGEHHSQSPNRNASNGVGFYHRYQDSETLYYVGLRVDGQATIKKKINGTYYELASAPIFAGRYDREQNPTLIPRDQWFGLIGEVQDQADGTVIIRMFFDRNRKGAWRLVAEAHDDGRVGGSAITEPGRGGIRTDFLDVEFDEYRILTITND
ncbi:hypothetical protein C4552_03880 [Candidatus Parcubacteria bacterium]|nr:MAG: hypothetical protein C4552_03880 [Candidatus Parcubacteria bacterium]